MHIMKVALIVLISLFSSYSFACGVIAPRSVNLAVSTREQTIFSYGLKSADESLPSAVVSNCRETAAKRRYVMITFGPEIIFGTDAIRGTNFDKQFIVNNSCTLKNNPLTRIQSNDDLKKNFDSKWKYINECVEITVTEISKRPLSFPADQTGCNITTINPQSAVFSGGFCLFKPGADSEYNVSVSVKESCKKLSGLSEAGVNLQDLESGVGFYTSSTYKDEINDLSAFGSFPVRLSTNPAPFLFKASDDFGILRPTFPADYALNDLHLGKLEIINQDGNSVGVKVPFIVDNFCREVSKNGIKSSICDYATPVVAHVELINSKGQVEASWYDGGIAPPQWQGVLNGEGFQISKELLRTNENYKIVTSFSDPYFEFNTFKKRIKSKFQAFSNGLPVFYAGGGISEIPDVQELKDINEMIDIAMIGDLDFKYPIGNLNGARRRLGAYFSTTLFPPMYDKFCHPETDKCELTGKPFVKFTASFKVNSDYSLSGVEVERNSKVLGSYKKKQDEQPEYICN